ncbi:hypothetical protein ACWIUD_00715 [Helicobacter sp. 23-1044]
MARIRVVIARFCVAKSWQSKMTIKRRGLPRSRPSATSRNDGVEIFALDSAF